MARVRNLHEFLDVFKLNLNRYVTDKEAFLFDELRDGGRGFTWRKAVNPIAMKRYFGGIFKNSDHVAAQDQRFISLAYAYYLIAKIDLIKETDSDADLQQVMQEVQAIFDYINRRAFKGTFFDLLQNTCDFQQANFPSKNVEKVPFKNNFYALWPIFLASRGTNELFDETDYSAARAYEYAILELDLNQDYSELFPQILKSLTDRAEQENLLSKNDGVLNKFDNGDPLNDIEIVKSTPTPVSLGLFYKVSDHVMNMEFNINRFRDFEITYIDHEGVHANYVEDGTKKEKILKDGWYQYVILADAPNQEQFRYFPCASSALPYLPYSKYISHSEMAAGQDVYAGGAFFIKNGVISLIDSSSGHYHIKQEHMDYAHQKLQDLGMPKNHEIEVKTNTKLTFSKMLKKIQRKVSAFLYALWSCKHPDLPQCAEGRPIPPSNLQGPHLANLRTTKYNTIFNALSQKMQNSHINVEQNATENNLQQYYNISSFSAS